MDSNTLNQTSLPQYLVFLHIPKTAGSAFRRKLYETYGIEQVFWYHLDSEATTFDAAELTNRNIIAIGGHRQFCFYPQDTPQFYFMSLLRDPISRTLSWYHYVGSNLKKHYANIDDSPLVAKNRFNPHSLTKTLQECVVFANQISNMQCQYLSGFSDAKTTMEIINEYPFLIGVQEQVEQYLHSCSQLLAWPPSSLSRLNYAESGYQQHLTLDPKGLDIIRQLNEADWYIYEWVKKQGVYFDPQKWRHIDKLLAPQARTLTVFANYEGNTIKLESVREPQQQESQHFAGKIRIINQSNTIIHPTATLQHFLTHQLYKQGKKYPHTDVRTPLTQIIYPQDNVIMPFSIQLPPEKGTYVLAATLLLDNLAWYLNDNYHEHCLYYELIIK